MNNATITRQVSRLPGFVLSTQYLVLCILCAFGSGYPSTLSAEFPRVPPTPPEKAEATFEVQHGFRMELIAAEPLVCDPVDLAYDEDGRAYVVEMRDYPYPEEKNVQPTVFPGTVRLLEDTDGDGKFDKATVFADQLAWPTSVCCYKGGVFVAAAPDIWYFKDTDGDRKADVRRKVFTGFSRYNVQAIMNSLRWGLDNKIYGAASGNGGTIQHVREGEAPAEPAISLTRRDFRFDPVTEKIEAISGGERYGACFDDWGNRFLCNIRNPVQHVVLPLHYLQRNPHLIVPSVIHDCAESGDQLRVYRISPPEAWREYRAQRWALEGANMPRSELIGAGYWTSSSGVCIYRGGAYPEQFRGNVFIGEVAGNLVHRQILERDGVTFKSRRADENTEFVRSRDNWFRPVNFVNAPDGTLTVLDMYRETIEHPWSIPDDIKAQLDLTSGNDRGRLYRLAPPEFEIQKPPKLKYLLAEDLVRHLSSDNSWHRETAQRLLYERAERAALSPLRQLAFSDALPQARLHALYLLDNFQLLSDKDFRHLLKDPDPEIRRHAVILAEREMINSYALRLEVGQLAENESPAVRFQVALSVGNLPTGKTMPAFVDLWRIGYRDADDPWVRPAIVSSSSGMAETVVLGIMSEVRRGKNPKLGHANLIRDLSAVVGAEGKPAAIQQLLNVAYQFPDSDLVYSLLAGLGKGLAKNRQKLSDQIAKAPDKIRKAIEMRTTNAAAISTDAKMAPLARIEALNLLAYSAWPIASESLFACISPTAPREVQQAALRTLGSFNEGAVASEVVSRWKQLTPPLRDEAVTILLSRPIWHEPLIAALESGEIPISQVSIPQRTRLAAIKDEKLAERTKKILASFTVGPRKEVIDRYQESLSLKGDAARGQTVYRRECMNCHKLRGEGHEVGPSLETIQHRSPQEILIHVLDPNREVSPNFLEYVVRLADGRVLTGLIAAETDAGLTLRRAQNQEDNILRSEIEEISSSGKSLMPEGIEQKIPPQEMADLIAYLKQNN
jgi:putative membrane-bound dehydrogenase-like protein